MRAILVRVGIDHSYGAWNAPADATSGRFVYVPIPEPSKTKFRPRCEHKYSEFLPALEQMAEACGLDLDRDLRFPRTLVNQAMHLDPDFEYLTYGDRGNLRGSGISSLCEDDMLVFYAGMRSTNPDDRQLIYALIGLFVVDEVVKAPKVQKHRWKENAHTRKTPICSTDIVVRAKQGVSGRLERFIPIGEYRNRAYRVRPDLLKAWGDLSVNDGYIQRSANPPRFLNAKRFHTWFKQHKIPLIEENNPRVARAKVIIVHLRQPKRSDPNEQRNDPFWEFGSFGCTRCHSRNLMNPKCIHELEGARLAFAQGGRGEFRLVMLTPPVSVENHGDFAEVKWQSTEMPFRFDAAPLLIDNDGETDFPEIMGLIENVDRTTWSTCFSSKFRSRRIPLPEEMGEQIIRQYSAIIRKVSSKSRATSYIDALPYPPNKVNVHRRKTYNGLLRQADGRRSCKPRVHDICVSDPRRRRGSKSVKC